MPNSRSLLLVPAHAGKRVEAAASSAVDVTVLDLAAGVPAAEKAAAREALAKSAERLKNAGKQVFVRINSQESGEAAADLDAAVGPALDAIILPDVKAAHQVRQLDVLIREQEVRHEVRPGTALLYPEIGSAAGLLRGEDIIQASTRIGGLILEGDAYAADLGVPRTRSGEELDFARSTLVNFCVAYRLRPLDGLFPFADDADGLAREAEYVRALGMVGKYLALPEHAESANDTFTG